jgi:hypothetical protein
MNHPYPDQKARLQALYRRNNLAASPADEHLLWLPDVFAWFERRLK